MTLSADLYFSFRSPYSYLAIGRYRRIAEEHDLEIRLRTVFPIAIRDPEFFERTNPLFARYLLRDIVRVAEHAGIPLALPRPDPVVMNMATREISPEQPHIRPISYLGVEAARRGRGVEFAHEASSLIWGGVENWNEGDHLAGAASRAGLDLAEMRAAIAGKEAACEAEIDENQQALEAAGHWGVPTFVFEGEPFFGQDRIDLALWRMEKRGLKRR